mmetsp:Transcript_5641/g.9924  ORF Transcript_5641/g.9924 Transcript_5641/m.9924 type:complete len:89 (+) Transcript_5641:195-461(+)
MCGGISSLLQNSETNLFEFIQMNLVNAPLREITCLTEKNQRKCLRSEGKFLDLEESSITLVVREDPLSSLLSSSLLRFESGVTTSLYT